MLSRKWVPALVLLTVCGHAALAQSPSWAGAWEGRLVNYPERPGAPVVEVTRELGEVPTTAATCTPFKTTYREGGDVKAVKDYRLCRGGADSLWVDEGDGVRLPSRIIGGVLVSPFKAGTILLVSQMRLRGDVLEEEILTVADAPATQGVVGLGARGIQRLEFRRRPGR
jgi:hypothetical protein